jgi:hypothetical protein
MTHIAVQEALNGKVVDWMERSARSSTMSQRHHSRIAHWSRCYLVTIYCSGARPGMTEQLLDDYIQSVTPAIPVGRTGTADEIANANHVPRVWNSSDGDPWNGRQAIGCLF